MDRLRAVQEAVRLVAPCRVNTFWQSRAHLDSFTLPSIHQGLPDCTDGGDAMLSYACPMVSDVDMYMCRSTQQIVALETQLQDANNKLLLQSMETGCLACRRAKLSGPPRQ